MTADNPNNSESENTNSPNTDEHRDSIDASPDEIFTALAARRRRAAIRHLAQDLPDGETITRNELATQVTAIVTDTDPHKVDTATRKSVYVALSNTHLDKLEAAGVITQTSDGIRTGEALETVADVIDHIQMACTADAAPQDGEQA